MARVLGVNIGDTLRVFYPHGRLTPLGMISFGKNLPRAPPYSNPGSGIIDSNWAYVNIDPRAGFSLSRRDSASVLQFKTDDLEGVEAIADDIRARAGDGLHHDYLDRAEQAALLRPEA